MKRKFSKNHFIFLAMIFYISVATFVSSSKSEDGLEKGSSSRPRRLLRVWPSYRPEECEWAIRKFICLRCLKNGHKYAQEIYFLEDGRPYRIHGCFTDEEIFFSIPEGRDHPTKFWFFSCLILTYSQTELGRLFYFCNMSLWLQWYNRDFSPWWTLWTDSKFPQDSLCFFPFSSFYLSF